MQEDVGAACHLVLPQVGDDQPLAVQFVRSLDARGDYGMALRRVAADDHHKVGLLDIRDRTGIAAVAHRSEKTGGCRRLAVTRAVVHVVGAGHRASQLLHQVTFFVGAFGGGDEGECVRGIVRFDFGEASGDQVQRLIPAGFTEVVPFADQWRG